MIRTCLALLVAAIAADSRAGADQPWLDLDGSGQGDPLVGLALLVLGYGVLKLLVSGDLIPLVRDIAKGILVLYAPLVLFFCILNS